MKFEFAAQRLAEANVPCRLTETLHGLVIEFGTRWPEELADVVRTVLPGYEGSMCACIMGHTVLNEVEICGGPQEYSFLGAYNF